MANQWMLTSGIYNMYSFGLQNPFIFNPLSTCNGTTFKYQENVRPLFNFNTQLLNTTLYTSTKGLSSKTGTRTQRSLSSDKSAFSNNLTSIARSYLGYNEADESYLRFTNGRREAWCADFVSYCARKAGNTSLNTSSVEDIRQWGIKNGKYHQTAKVGDAIILKNRASHTGIIESITGNNITVIEGNSSDKVQRVTYNINDSRISGFVTLA